MDLEEICLRVYWICYRIFLAIYCINFHLPFLILLSSVRCTPQVWGLCLYIWTGTGYVLTEKTNDKWLFAKFVHFLSEYDIISLTDRGPATSQPLAVGIIAASIECNSATCFLRKWLCKCLTIDSTFYKRFFPPLLWNQLFCIELMFLDRMFDCK